MRSRIPAVGFVSGLLFGVGLAVSGMTRPGKVQQFLDVTGQWDPSLGLVMGTAVLVSAVSYAWLDRRRSPWFAGGAHVPTTRHVDARLVTGAALFGVGWALAGLCPGPALTSLATLAPVPLTFTVTMVVGVLAHDALRARFASDGR